MDDLDRSLAELRRVMIDGAIRAELGRWSAAAAGRAATPADPRNALAVDPVADPRRANAVRGRPGWERERPEAGAAARARSVGQKRAAWRRARGPVIAVIVAALTLLLML